MTMEITDSERQTIDRAMTRLRFWRYGRWVQIVAGIALIAVSFWLIGSGSHANTSAALPPHLLGPLGGAMLGEAIAKWHSVERVLLLKLYSAQIEK